jgi:hypothetical protein
MIEARSKIEKTVAYDDAEPLRDLSDRGEANPPHEYQIRHRIRRWVRVWLVDNSLGLIFNPSVDLSFETLEMFVCPL